MDAFNFEIILNYKMVTSAIKPPASYSCLVDVAKEKFDLKIINRMVFINDDSEVKISNDSEYLKLFDYVVENNLTEIENLKLIEKEKEKERRAHLQITLCNQINEKKKRNEHFKLIERTPEMDKPIESQPPPCGDDCVLCKRKYLKDFLNPREVFRKIAEKNNTCI